MGNIIILTKILSIYEFISFKRMVIEMLLNNDIQIFFSHMILYFQKEINVIMNINEIKKTKTRIISFEQNFSKI